MLAPGTKLGRYEIRSQLGVGGMGEVYRARDTQLGRDVAIKVLPATISTDPDRLRRFEQEACAAGALNHPNILVVHDIGTHDGSSYVVSELLEGETLRKRIAGTPLAHRRVIEYSLQIVNGLAAAHAKGIIHRDLKPENIFLTNDGRLKILDFGLAKLTQVDGDLVQTEVPTRRIDTEPGVVMGTVGYMSPEQLKGQHVDQRSDIFSFGAILYEMLSGRRAFHGESAAETMSAVLKEDPPDLSDTNQKISPSLERLVNRCLEKSPESRFHSASDLAFALEALSETNTSSAQTAIAPAWERPRSRERLWWIGSTGLLAFALFAALPFVVAYFRRPAPAPGHVTRFFVPPPEKSSIIGGGEHISPDGTRLVYVSNGADGNRLLWTRPLDSLAAQPLAGTEGAGNPFWSPDSRFVGYFTAGLKLKKIDVNGGSPQTLTDVQGGLGGTWNGEDTIVFARSSSDGLYRISANGGTPARVTALDESRKEIAHVWPYFLPDGRHFLYLARSAQKENTGIYVGSLDAPDRKLLVSADSSAVYAAPGFLLFLRDRNLMAQAFDANSLQLTGEPLSIAEQVGYNLITGRSFFSASQNGVIAFLNNNPPKTQLAWFDRTGKQLALVGGPGADTGLRLSPDEKQLAVSRLDTQAGSADIWVIDLSRNNPSRFTFDPGNDSAPVWSADGSRIMFASSRTGIVNVYQRLANGTRDDELFFKFPQSAGPLDCSPDGKFLLFGTVSPTKGNDLWLLPLTGDQKPMPFIETQFNETQARFSYDGRWVAYSSNESGQFQIYIQSFPTAGGKWQVSTGGGAQPQWRRDGKELYYLAPDRKLMAVELSAAGPTITPGIPTPLFEARITGVFPGQGGASYYAASGDGKRFLVNMLLSDTTPVSLTVVLNWTAGLKR